MTEDTIIVTISDEKSKTPFLDAMLNEISNEFQLSKKDLCLKIINHYGVNNQQRKLAEEVFELQEAIINYELKASVEYEIPLTEIIGSKEHIIEELADCMVLLSQFKEYYGISEKELQEVDKYKIERQLERMQKAKGDVK